MKIVWNTCKKELGETKPVNAMKTSTKSLFENFQSQQHPFREIYVKYFEKSSIQFMALLHSFLQFQIALYEIKKLTMNIRWTFDSHAKHSINQ